MMTLAASLTTVDGDTAPVVGGLPADVEVHDSYRALDHVEMVARDGTLTAPADGRLRGREFHSSGAAVGSDARFAFDVERGDGIDGHHDSPTEYRTPGT